MPLKCFVIDDIPAIIRLIKRFSEQSEFTTFLGGETDVLKAMKLLLAGEIKPDVIFLDIEMPGVSGLDLIEPLSKIADVILISGHKEFGQQAFEQGATAYIYKPFDLAKFQETVQRIFNKKNMPDTVKTAPAPFYYIPGDGREVRIRLKSEEIWFAETTGNFTVVKMIDNTSHICNLTLTELTELLPSPHFIRINRSTLISLSKVEFYDAKDIHLEKGKVFTFGDSYRKEFIRLIRQYGMLH
ncbi:MAG: hypothetical protein BGO31_11090 [Bacteroidetes bacterium 43-16]|uniref:LytR/AlgR family response regulator transcription factor n=1 Tax=uncultured Dysgonomonas sp. TaxID=206096 RepID=UPI00092B7F0F|nr:LytTR family DNA-binding domain-containing protein [uncultured Dysgonomonas sp.]OJV51004.1 MAG: hypothetical protein BGO31_11090 [Bacteroidetes bacterium 43-16]